MRSVIITLLSGFLLLGLTQCESIKTKSKSALLVTGKVGEIMVVCETGLWETEIKQHLDSGLTQFIMPYMPDVVTFELVHRTPEKFESGIKRFRNTLFISVDPSYTGDAGKIEKRKDIWADDQLVIDIVGKDYNQVLNVCKNGLEKVHEEFDYMEWKRILNRYEYSGPEHVINEIEQNFGISVSVPSGSRIVTKRKNFYRLEFPETSRPIEFVGTGSQDAGAIYTGLMVYQYDYVDSTQLRFDQLMAARDTMLKYNVPSEVEGMYMGTQYTDLVYPEGGAMTSELGNVKGYEIRGMFVFKGRPRFGTGGGFWSFHFVHPEKKKIICVSGYVDAPPTTSWTHPIREIQAILNSVKIVP